MSKLRTLEGPKLAGFFSDTFGSNVLTRNMDRGTNVVADTVGETVSIMIIDPLRETGDALDALAKGNYKEAFWHVLSITPIDEGWNATQKWIKDQVEQAFANKMQELQTTTTVTTGSDQQANALRLLYQQGYTDVATDFVMSKVLYVAQQAFDVLKNAVINAVSGINGAASVVIIVGDVIWNQIIVPLVQSLVAKVIATVSGEFGIQPKESTMSNATIATLSQGLAASSGVPVATIMNDYAQWEKFVTSVGVYPSWATYASNFANAISRGYSTVMASLMAAKTNTTSPTAATTWLQNLAAQYNIPLATVNADWRSYQSLVSGNTGKLPTSTEYATKLGQARASGYATVMAQVQGIGRQTTATTSPTGQSAVAKVTFTRPTSMSYSAGSGAVSSFNVSEPGVQATTEKSSSLIPIALAAAAALFFLG